MTPWTLLHYYFESLQVGRSLYKGMPPTQPAVLKSCPGIHHIFCHRKEHKDWASSCTTLCSHLESLLFLELKPAIHASPEGNFKTQIKINLWDAAHTSNTPKQTAGAAQAGLLWEGSRALPHLSRPQMGLQPLYTNPNYLVSFFLFVCFLQSIIPFKANSGFSCCQEQGFIASAWLPLGHMGRRDKLSLSVSADHR